MVRAEMSLTHARDNSVKKYAPLELEEAEALMQVAREEMAFQQGKLSLFRKFAYADSLIAGAKSLTEVARDSALARRQRALDLASAEVDTLAVDLRLWRQELDESLTLYRAEKLFSMAQMSHQSAATLLREDDLEAALSSAQECREHLSALRNAINHHDADEQARINAAKRWVAETLAESRRTGAKAVIVDKDEHKLHLYDGGKLMKSYRCDLGFNAAYQKLFAGDGATPEGSYQISKVNQGSRYFKALLLNYPNDEDKSRFAANKKSGRISKRANIGRLIEIHGHGGQDKDWTDGCVALSDSDMLDLMRHVGAGTRVTIVRKLS
jgi:murein L,D-transpeptidase YafK